MRSAALVSADGTIDFFCFPEFDSPSVFASLLDSERAGCFSLRPTEDGYQQKQLYIPETNILLTRFLSDEAVAEISDFMPLGLHGDHHGIMRRAVVLQGEIEFTLQCAPAFDYARSKHVAAMQGDSVLFTPESSECTPMLLESFSPAKSTAR